MNSIMKKLLLAVMCLVVMCAAGALAEATEGECGNDLTWKIENEVLTISGTGKMWSFESEGATPWYGQKISSIVMEPGITKIGNYAFRGHDFRSVSMPDTLLEIGKSAFGYCDFVTEIVIPDSVTTMGSEVFMRCYSLTNVKLPSSLTDVPEKAFYMCYSLSGIEIPASVKSIGANAFCECESLTDVKLNNGLETIGEDAFFLCEKLPSIELPNTLKNLCEGAFRACRALEGIYIPDSVTNLSARAFDGCNSVTSIRISNNITSIPEKCFFETGINASIASVEIPAGVTEIGPYSFSRCNTENISIPNTVTTIGTCAFDGCEKLKSLTIPDSVTFMDRKVASWCDVLKSVKLGKGATVIPELAFYKGYLVGGVEIPEGYTTIESEAFAQSSLQEISLPVTIESMAIDAFYGCSAMSDIYIYNPELSLDRMYVSNEDLTFHGYAGSTAEAFAAANGYKFVLIPGEPPVKPTPTPEPTPEPVPTPEPTPAPVTVPVTKVELSLEKVTIGAGQKVSTVKVSVYPENATDKSVTWTSSNSSVATVDANGKIKGVKKGSAVITVKAANGVSDTVEVKVVAKGKGVTKIKLNKKSASIEAGKSLALKATITPSTAKNKKVVWVSSDTSVATVDAKGKVKAVAPGKATITATASSGKSAKCEITVTGAKVRKIVIKGEKQMKVGESQALTVKIKPLNAENQELKWKSSSKKIATVDENGVVTAIKKGTVVITAKATDGSKVKATFRIVIKK